MSILQDFTSGTTQINGKIVTDDNIEKLINNDIRNKSLDILDEAMMEIAGLWPGTEYTKERERILRILDTARNKI